jgi:ABC-2 type transport system ATP-binding protein
VLQPVVRVDNVSKIFRRYHERAYSLKERVVNRRRSSYEEFWAVKDVSMEIGRQETAGLIGPNGSGKSTLLKLVAGIIRPTEGRIETRGRIASLLELGAGFHPDLTGRENVYLNASILGLSKKDTDKHFDDIVAFAELEPFIDTQIRHYSSGMFVRLGFAVAVHVDPEILIIDEVLSVGDEAFQRKCLDRIRLFQAEGRTIVFVTHAVDLVREICNRAFFLWQGELVAEGRPADVIREFRQKLHGEAHLEAAPQEERGSGEVRMAEVRLLDGEGAERQIFAPGEPLELQIVLDADRPVDDAAVGFIFYDEREAVVYGTNTIMAGTKLGRLEGKTRLRFRVPALPALNGTYRITIGVHSEDDRKVYHWKEKAWAMRVVNPSSDIGTFHFSPKIEVEHL